MRCLAQTLFSLPWSGSFFTRSCLIASFQLEQPVLQGAQRLHLLQDAFPAPVASANGFQRHATVLVYLNDVSQVFTGPMLGSDQ